MSMFSYCYGSCVILDIARGLLLCRHALTKYFLKAVEKKAADR